MCALFGFWLCVCFLLLFPLLDIFEGFFAKASAPAHVCRFLQFRPPLFSSSSSSPLFHCFLCSSSLRQSNKAWTSPGPRHRECSPVWLTRTVLFCLSNTSRRSCNHCLCLCVVSPTYFFFFFVKTIKTCLALLSRIRASVAKTMCLLHPRTCTRNGAACTSGHRGLAHAHVIAAEDTRAGPAHGRHPGTAEGGTDLATAAEKGGGTATTTTTGAGGEEMIAREVRGVTDDTRQMTGVASMSAAHSRANDNGLSALAPLSLPPFLLPPLP